MLSCAFEHSMDIIHVRYYYYYTKNEFYCWQTELRQSDYTFLTKGCFLWSDIWETEKLFNLDFDTISRCIWQFFFENNDWKYCCLSLRYECWDVCIEANSREIKLGADGFRKFRLILMYVSLTLLQNSRQFCVTYLLFALSTCIVNFLLWGIC